MSDPEIPLEELIALAAEKHGGEVAPLRSYWID